ncbi:MAG TPA: L-fucose:H+ symporter permease [Steroidobacteraceae bacterium]|nr:L-fucose:H+ symporter permease [Steroidobacteraceae bacterium]
MQQNNETASRYTIAMVLIVGLFLMWGIANSLNDVLVAQFRKAFELNDFQSGLVQSAFYIGYFSFSIPASLFMSRFGYRAAIILGLVLYAAGAFLFYPAAELQRYGFFLGALFVIASGLAFLETSANPLMTVLGPPESADRRLNFAQSFNPLGAITGAALGSHLIFSDVHYSPEQLQQLTQAQLEAYYRTEAHAVQLPYLLLGSLVLIWAVLVACAKFPPVEENRNSTDEQPSGFRALLKHKHFWYGVVAQFFYVGAQVGIWSYVIRYTQFNFPGTTEKAASHYLTASLVLFMIGRFVGTYLMKRYSAARLMAIFAFANVLLVGIAIFGSHTGLYALVGASFFMSIMFPTIFSLSLRGLGAATKAGSSFLVMAIVGGAALTAIMGQISVASSINTALCVPMVCFVVILAFSWNSRERSPLTR